MPLGTRTGPGLPQARAGDGRKNLFSLVLFVLGAPPSRRFSRRARRARRFRRNRGLLCYYSNFRAGASGGQNEHRELQPSAWRASDRYAFGVQKNLLYFTTTRKLRPNGSREAPPPHAARAISRFARHSSPAGGDSQIFEKPCLHARQRNHVRTTESCSDCFRYLGAARGIKVDTARFECRAAPSPAGILKRFRQVRNF